MDIEKIYSLYKQNYLVDTDTRKIRKNSLFFALKGDNFNGNKFALDALKKGAKYAIVDEDVDNNERIIKVNNTLSTLQKLASYHRKVLNIPVISLTGSNGKTTTKELINTVLSKKYNTTATIGNLNNHIGVPLTLLSMTDKTEIGIIEMGANHHNEIALLSEIASPDYGYITNFGKAHLEGFGSLEGVIKAKSELYDYIFKNNKKVFINPDDPTQLKKTTNHNRVLFDTSIRFKEVNPYVSIAFGNKDIKTNLIGKYNYSNITAAITIGKYFKVNNDAIIDAIQNYIPNNNRSQVIDTKENQIILDAYNANPSSMKVAIENFSLLKNENKILILGDMFELGDASLEEHQQIVQLINNLKFENVFLVGENFHQTNTGYLKFKTFKEIKTYFQQNSFIKKTFLIKGSRGMTLEKLLDFIN